MIVTRTLLANAPSELASICKFTGFIRADIWRRFGALNTVGKNANAIRTEISTRALYDKLPVDGTIRAETTKDIVNDLLTYKAAAKLKVRQAIAKRTSDEGERKRLYTLLKRDEWLSVRHWLVSKITRKTRFNLSQTRLIPSRSLANIEPHRERGNYESGKD